VTRTRRRHAARFIIIGLYSARREGTIRRTQWFANTTGPWFDLERWVYHGRGSEERRTKKRRPPAKVANRLRPHLARWHRMDAALSERLGRPVTHVVHKFDGTPLVDKIKTGWNGILADAGLDRDVVRHVLRHTAATWIMQSGPRNLWEAAGFLGMTMEMLEDVYGHHHPDFQDEVAAAFG
jgi:integrase